MPDNCMDHIRVAVRVYAPDLRQELTEPPRALGIFCQARQELEFVFGEVK